MAFAITVSVRLVSTAAALPLAPPAFGAAWPTGATWKMVWTMSCRRRSSSPSKASWPCFLYMTRGSRWPYAYRPMPWRRLDIMVRCCTQSRSMVCSMTARSMARIVSAPYSSSRCS